ncbi:cytochrome b561 domain-containing protein 2 [Scaptodrosophila lebanonensis]|uniref:ascorbate ferrireductase (transmembrane) n=1 Tax=Drosophila lebanonensis TaxID=7225 RepID=A0A6J2TKD7_DROLE|nr:cytochrome b561 domain-containing protein 2 [Scaptodrosophila lebanonensis]
MMTTERPLAPISSSSQIVDYGSTTTAGAPESESKRETIQAELFQRFPSFVRAREPQRYTRITMDSVYKSDSRQKLLRLEFFLNVINQICIGFVTIYMSWLTLRTGLEGTGLHAWLVTIGFSFFMAQGVMVHYNGNVLTNHYKRTTKTTIHWILLTLGGGCGAAGALIKMIQKGFLLQSTHGKLGLTAFILCLLAMLSGLSALFSSSIKKLISPLLNKTFHNFIGFSCFVIALTTQYYGYQTGYFKNRSVVDFQILMKCLTLISLVLTSYGPMKALYHKLKNIARNFN